MPRLDLPPAAARRNNNNVYDVNPSDSSPESCSWPPSPAGIRHGFDEDDGVYTDPEDDSATSVPATPGAFHYFSVKRQEPLPTQKVAAKKKNNAPKAKKEPCCGNHCSSFSRRFSPSSFLASLLVCTGAGLFSVRLKNGVDTILVLLQETMHITYKWMEAAQIACTAAGIIMMAIGGLVFAASFITAAWSQDYPGGCSSKKRNPKEKPLRKPAGRCTPLLLILLLYPTLPAWLFFLAISIFFAFVSYTLNGSCLNEYNHPIWNQTPPPDPSDTVCKTVLEGKDCVECIDLYQFHFMFPPSARKEDMWLCGYEMWRVCSSDMPAIVEDWLVCVSGCLLVVVGVCIHLTQLSYTRAMLGEERNLKEQAELALYQDQVRLKQSHGLSSSTPLIMQQQQPRTASVRLR